MRYPSSLPCVNFYRSDHIAENVILVTVDSGDWKLFSSDDYTRLCNKDFSNADFLQELKESFIYLDADNYDAYIEKRQECWDQIFQPPSLHIVVITSFCNLRCIYCHAGHSQATAQHMSIETALQVLDKIMETPASSLTLEIQGGEPTANFPVVKELILEAKNRAQVTEKDLQICIVTNFTELLTDDKMKFLISNGVEVSTSIDGPEDIHQHNRNQNYPNGFAILKERIAAFRKIWSGLRQDEPRLSAMLTTTQAVLQSPRETIDAYLNLGFGELFVRPVTPIGRGEKECGDFSYCPEEFVHYWSKLIDYVIELRSNGVKISESHLNLLLRKIFHHEYGYMDLRFPCGASYGQRAYSPDGSIYSCDEGRMLKEQDFCIGSIDDSLALLNRSPNGLAAFEASLAELSYCEFCAYKPFCGICPILNWKQTGNMITSTYDSRRCKIYKGMIKYIFCKFLTDPTARRVFDEIVIEDIDCR